MRAWHLGARQPLYDTAFSAEQVLYRVLAEGVIDVKHDYSGITNLQLGILLNDAAYRLDHSMRRTVALAS